MTVYKTKEKQQTILEHDLIQCVLLTIRRKEINIGKLCMDQLQLSDWLIKIKTILLDYKKKFKI